MEDDERLLVPLVHQAVLDVDGDEQGVARVQLVRLAVEARGDRPADDVDELLGVRVVVLGDPVPARNRGDAHEAGRRADGLRAEQRPDVAAASRVGRRLLDLPDTRLRLMSFHNSSSLGACDRAILAPEMGGIAFLYPGQGSQKVGMGAELLEAEGDLLEGYLAQAEAASGQQIRRICLEGPMEALTRTEVAQPALFCVSLAVTDAARARDLEPDFVAGHSLGEYTAACASGAVSVEDAIELVCLRGRLMGEIGDERPGAMGRVSAGARRRRRGDVPRIGAGARARRARPPDSPGCRHRLDRDPRRPRRIRRWPSLSFSPRAQASPLSSSSTRPSRAVWRPGSRQSRPTSV